MVRDSLVRAFWAMVPAYVPNNVAVLVGGGPPIDVGCTWCGRRLLGDGKTWRGTFAGVLAGVALAALLNALRGRASDVAGIALPRFGVAALSLPLGAMLGDMAASFYKRRSGRERGAPAPGLDQFDFVLGALCLTRLFAPRWFRRTFRVPVLAAVIVMTPLLHLGTNYLAYRLGLKSEPH